MTAKAVGVFQSSYPVVFLHTVLATRLFGLRDIDLYHRGGTDELAGDV